ncbi:unnamed protein product [Caenorhabditis auriculariae]|uniref:Ras-associating domain-containing protein n=1 Tax=Caenorhabditis auriculariae TaxID=2777116 RepID=A0A8S1HRW8_9PELO|nr:unnamed protein product [Caenorhabditis auriculariae]
MLKYQVRASSHSSRPLYSVSPTSSTASSSFHDASLTSRSNSLVSLNSIDSCGSDADIGALKIDTSRIKQCTDYKTIRVSTNTPTKTVIEQVLNKFKLTCRDTNLFELWMEIITKADGKPVRTLMKLDSESRPLELQRCHPAGMSRFVLHMNSTGTLVRVYDHNISPQSNYKSLILSSLTTADEAIHLVLAMNRRHNDDSTYGLFLTAPDAEAQIPGDVSLVSIASMCKAEHKIVIRLVNSL